jgi:uncharacterized membrane protein YeiH
MPPRDGAATPLGDLLSNAAEWTGVGVFALTGALVAARKGMDPFGFALLATVTGIGGGSVRDMLLGVPVFWVGEPTDVLVCIGVAVLTFLLGRHVPALDSVPRARRVLLWADGMGLAIFAVTGTAKALASGAHPLAATMLGAMTASFGGIIRDILAGETPLVLHREIYVTAAFAGAAVYVACLQVGLPPPAAGIVGFLMGFTLRALAIARDWSLPSFKASRN